MQGNCNIFSRKFFARMLKNILAEHTELLPFINYKQYICNMEKLKEFVKAAQKEKILNAFQNNSDIVYLDNLKGDREENISTIILLEDDGCLKVTRYIGGKMNIMLTEKGCVYKKLKIYSKLERKLRIKKSIILFWSIISFIIGLIVDKLDILIPLLCGKN